MFFHSFESVQDFLHLGGNMCSLLRVCCNFYMSAWLRHTVCRIS
jgi:predicted DNA-binding ribbon-helix-helix protein